jgi:hypothetical protein
VDVNSVGSMRQDPLLSKWGQHRYRDIVPSHFADVARYGCCSFFGARIP